jgi:lipoyl(octanoyl) transferase
MPELWAVRLGLTPYVDAWALQKAVAAARIAGAIPDTLLLCEHPPVLTLGRSSVASHLTATPAMLAARGVRVHEVERGGDVTMHAPGQLVAYPIIDLAGHRPDLHWYLRALEGTLIDALATLAIPATRRPGLTGVWTGDAVDAGGALRKIASIGVHVRRWVTWHGLALNVTTDLSLFDLIVPCGIPDVEMTSIARERPGLGVDVDSVAPVVTAAFAERFGLRPTVTAVDALLAAAPA